MSLMSRHGLRPNKLTNIWVPFVVGATMLLRPGGRLALVLPAELLQVSYASQLRCFLVDSFKRIDVVACNELFFVDAEQEVVLLLADGKLAERSPTNRCQIDLKVKKCVSEVLSSSLFPPARIARPKLVQHDSEKWLKYFLTAGEISFMRELRQSPEIGTLADHAGIDVGIVTGDNDFFVLKMSQARSLGVDKYTIPLVGRSSQLPGAVLDASDWGSLVAHDKAVLLFYLNGHAYDGLSVSAKHYISHGEAHKVHEGYKCSIRSPWYKVPAVWEPHCFLFRQIYDFPRMVLNSAKAVSTDTIHRATCKASPAKTAANVYTHLTAASAEIEGRSYGGGVLELEPTEAERILMPRSLQPGLPIHEIDRLVKAGKIAHVLAENDRNILMKGIGLSERDCVKLKDIWAKMRTRRHSRRKN